MRNNYLSAVVLLCVVCLAVGGCGGRIMSGDDSRIVGKWHVKDGDTVKDSPLITLTSDEVTVDFSDVSFEGSYGANTSKEPDQVDVRVESAGGSTELLIASILFHLVPLGRLKVFEGVYAFEDDNTVKMTFKPKLFGRPDSVAEDTGADDNHLQFTVELVRVQ